MEEMNNFEKVSSSANQQISESEDISKDVEKINDLVNRGVLNPQQGQYYMSQLAKKSTERLSQDNIQSALNRDANAALEEFIREKPEFFRADGRGDILNYLQNSSFIVDKDEISLISQMVEKLEQCAVERYIKQQEHEKILNENNEIAKRKLKANAQNTSSLGNGSNRLFTREQIGRMSGAEFTKNEPLIMEQLRKGLIK